MGLKSSGFLECLKRKKNELYLKKKNFLFEFSAESEATKVVEREVIYFAYYTKIMDAKIKKINFVCK